MLYWTLRSLMTEVASVAAAAAGTAIALILALYLDAVFRGEAKQIVVFIERMPASVWVLQDGVRNLHMARSRLSDNTLAEVARMPGIRSATPVVYGSVGVGDPKRERAAYLVGVPADPALRSRWTRVTGWPMPKGGVVAPETIAKEANLKIGDKLRIGDASYTISGLSSDTFSMANPLVFMDERDARRELDIGDGASLVLVEPEAGINPAALADRINAASDKLRALTRAALRANDYTLALQMGGALIGMLSLMATAVSVLIVTFTAYAFVSARTQELAVAKALGAPKGQLLVCAVVQTSVVAVAGAAVAVVLIAPMQVALTAWVPDVAVDFSYLTALKLSATTMVVAIAAALVPAFYVLKVDPALVFKG